MMSENYTKITCEKGKCSIDSSLEIYGIQIEFTGKARIIPTLPDSWVLRGNNNKIIIFSLQGFAITNTSLFDYVGNINLKNVLVCNKDGSSYNASINKSKYTWSELSFEWQSSTNQSYADLSNPFSNNGRVRKTQYIYAYDGNLKSSEGEFYLNGSAYNGSYHIPKDTNIPMSGPFPSKKSQPLSRDIPDTSKNINKKNNKKIKKGGY